MKREKKVFSAMEFYFEEKIEAKKSGKKRNHWKIIKGSKKEMQRQLFFNMKPVFDFFSKKNTEKRRDGLMQRMCRGRDQ